MKAIVFLSLLAALSACTGSGGGSGSASSFDDSPSQTEGLFKLAAGAPMASATKIQAKNNGNGNSGGNSGGNGGGAGNSDKDPETATQFDQILVSISEVWAYSDERGWEVVNSNPQTVDLLTLKEDASIVLAQKRLLPGHYSEIRLKLTKAVGISAGQETTIKVPSGARSGLKLKTPFVLEKGRITSLTLRFDASKSIVRKGNGSYSLKPVIHMDGFHEDLVAPLLSVNFEDNTRNRNNQLLVSVEDESSTTTEIVRNGQVEFTTTSKEFTRTLADGVHQFEIRSTDANTNTSSVTFTNLIVDTIPPVLTIAPIPTIYTQTVPVTVAINGTSNEDLSSVSVGAILGTFLADAREFSFALPISASTSFSVKGVDLAGNESTAIVPVQLVVDTTPPVISLTQSGPNPTNAFQTQIIDKRISIYVS
jgi:hypothetical protein